LRANARLCWVSLAARPNLRLNTGLDSLGRVP